MPELKYMGTTKQDIWNAYKEKVAELEELKKNGPASTTEKAKKETVARSINTATQI